jgi:hypothetical protein
MQLQHGQKKFETGNEDLITTDHFQIQAHTASKDGDEDYNWRRGTPASIDAAQWEEYKRTDVTEAVEALYKEASMQSTAGCQTW